MEQQLEIQVALCPGGKKCDVLACWGCLYLPKAKKCLQSQPSALGTFPARQSHGERETGPLVASLGQGLVAPRDLLLPSVWMRLAQTKGNIHCWPWRYLNHSPLDFKFSVVRLSKYYKTRMVFL